MMDIEENFPYPENYNPKNSKTTFETLSNYLAQPFSANLDDIPGIGKRIVQYLAEPSELFNYKPITNAYQLLGKFLSFKENGMSSVRHCELFYQWLLEKGVRHNTTEIVQAIAEKAATWMPNLYDASAYVNMPVVDRGWVEKPHIHDHPGAKEVPLHNGQPATASDTAWVTQPHIHSHPGEKELFIRGNSAPIVKPATDSGWQQQPLSHLHPGAKEVSLHNGPAGNSDWVEKPPSHQHPGAREVPIRGDI